MGNNGERRRLIESRPAAIIAVLLTGFLAVLAVRGAFFASQHHSRWLFPSFFSSPGWAFLAVQFAFYGYLLWLCVAIFRRALGRERVVVMAWFVVILAGPLETRVPAPVSAILERIGAFGMAVAFLIAVDILLTQLSRRPIT